jgi:hypothetical protein
MTPSAAACQERALNVQELLAGIQRLGFPVILDLNPVRYPNRQTLSFGSEEEMLAADLLKLFDGARTAGTGEIGIRKPL